MNDPSPLFHHRLVAAVAVVLAAGAAAARRTAASAAGAELFHRLHEHVEREDDRQQRERTFGRAGDERTIGQEVRVVRGVQRDEGDDGVHEGGDPRGDRATHAFGTGHHRKGGKESMAPL